MLILFLVFKCRISKIMRSKKGVRPHAHSCHTNYIVAKRKAPAGSNTNRGFHFKSYSYYQIQYLTKPNTLSINYHKIPGSHSVSSHSTTFSNSIKCEAFTKIVSPSWIIPGSASLRLSFSAKCTISFVGAASLAASAISPASSPCLLYTSPSPRDCS